MSTSSPSAASGLPHQPAGKSSSSWHGLVEADDPTEPLPLELNTIDAPRCLGVAKDKRSVKYLGKGNHSLDCGACRTEWPCPRRSLVYYFEVTVVDAGLRGSVAIGVADGSFPLNRQPGWEPNSYAYHGHDGRRYSDSERGEPYGPRFGSGDVRPAPPHPTQPHPTPDTPHACVGKHDAPHPLPSRLQVIGCGLLSERRELFFTKNGKHLGVAFSPIDGVVYPTFGLHSTGECISINLGSEPFAFDIDAVIKSTRESRVAYIAGPQFEAPAVHSLVRSYLLHHNYSRTLSSLDAARAEDAAEKGQEGASVAAAEAGAKGSGAACAMPPAVVSNGAASNGAASNGDASNGDASNGDASNGDAAAMEKGGDASSGGGGGADAAEPMHVVDGELPPAPTQPSKPAAPADSCANGAARGSDPESVMSRSMEQRRRLQSLVHAGDAAGAAKYIDATFPGLLERNSDARLLLCCQHFIELLRGGEPIQAITYAQSHLAPYQQASQQASQQAPRDACSEPTPSDTEPAQNPAGFKSAGAAPSNPAAAAADAAEDAEGGEEEEERAGHAAAHRMKPEERQALLRDVIALIAYDDPSANPDSSSSHLMSDAQREAVGDALNGAVLEELGLSPTCSVEWLLRQLLVASAAIREANQGYGEDVRFGESGR